MTIDQQPAAYNFAGNIPDFIIDTPDPLPFQLLFGATVLLDETYTPSPANKVTIKLSDFLDQYLSVIVPDRSLDTYDQDAGFGEFTAVLGDGSSPDEVTFYVIKGGLSSITSDQDYFAANFLTWQPAIKKIKDTDIEWLTYFADAEVTVKARGTDIDGVEDLIDLYTIPANQLVSINVSPYQIEELFSNIPIQYDFWVEDADDEKISATQTLIISDEDQISDALFVFENTLGGVDTIRFIGQKTTEDKSSIDSSLFDKTDVEYFVTPKREISVNSGDLTSARKIAWTKDFLRSTQKYHFDNQQLKRIVAVSHKAVDVINELNSYEFTFKYSLEKKYQEFGIPPIKLAAPSGLVASNPTNSTIDLNWTSNSNKNEFGFNIYISDDGEDGTYVLAGSVGNNVLTYTSTGLTSGTQYWFKVYAVGYITSKASNVATTTTAIDFGLALSLDPVNDYVSIHSDIIGDTIPEDHTIAFYYKMNNSQSSNRIIYSTADATSGATEQYGIGIENTDGVGTFKRRLYVFFETANNYQFFRTIDSTSFPDFPVNVFDGEIHRIVLRRYAIDATYFRFDLFIDGQLCGLLGDLGSIRDYLDFEKADFPSLFQSINYIGRSTIGADMTVDRFSFISEKVSDENIILDFNDGSGSNIFLSLYTSKFIYEFNKVGAVSEGNNTALSLQVDDSSGNALHGTATNFAMNGTTSNYVDPY